MTTVIDSPASSSPLHRCAPLLITRGQVDIHPDTAPLVTFEGSWPLRRVESSVRRLVHAKLISHASVTPAPRGRWGRRQAQMVRIAFGYDVTIVDDGLERTLVCQEMLDEQRAWALGRALCHSGLIDDVRMLTSHGGPVVLHSRR